MFSNQLAGAEDTLARETSRLAGETSRVGSETSALGAEKGAALTSIGRNVGSSIEAGGQAAVQYLEHKDISQGSAAYAQLFAQKTQQWNDIANKSDPNDPTTAPKFMQSLEGDLATFKDDGFLTEGGQKWAEAHVDALRQHLAEKTQADMASKAGDAVIVNQKQMVNSLSAGVHGDPQSLDFAIAALKSSTEGQISSSPNLNVAQASRVRSEYLQTGMESIVKSAAIGYIEKTATIPPWATDPKYAPYINGAELQMLEKAAKTQAKVDNLTNKQAEIAQRQINERKAEGAANQSLTNNVKIDQQTSKPVINPQFFKDALDIAKMPDAPQGLARTLIDWGESQQNKETRPVDDSATRQGLTDRLFDPTNPTTRQDLMRAQVAGKLSDHSFQSMERLVTELETSPLKGPIWQDTAAAVKGELILSGVGIPGKDIPGEANYAKWAQTFIPQYLAKSRAGTLPPNALDVKDPTSMISQSMAPFKRTVTQRANDYVSSLGGTATGIPAARNDAMPAIPAPDQRPAGSIYETPKGKMKWTGTGWVTP